MASTQFKDVDMNHPWVKEYRLPVLDFQVAHQGYVVAVVVPEKEMEESQFYALTSPTDEEAKVIASFLEYTKTTMRNTPAKLAQMAEGPLDVDNTWNTIIIMKRKDGTWSYCRNFWTMAPSPQVGWDRQCRSVVEILDYIEHDCFTGQPNEKWTAWKQEHGIS